LGTFRPEFFFRKSQRHALHLLGFVQLFSAFQEVAQRVEYSDGDLRLRFARGLLNRKRAPQKRFGFRIVSG
jgi:hypothetical protein